MKEKVFFIALIFLSFYIIAESPNQMFPLDDFSSKMEFKKMTVYYQRTEDSVDFVVVGQTKGWVAIGFNSSKMDGSHIVFGYFSKGEAVYSEELGNGHRHKPYSENWVEDLSIEEVDGQTVMRFSIPYSKLMIVENQTPFIVAQGPIDRFIIHNFRSAGVLTFE